MQIFVLFAVLTVLVLLGEDKQSIVLVIASIGVLSLYIYDWYTNKTRFLMNKSLVVCWGFFGFSLILSSTQALSLGYAVTEIVKHATAFLLFLYFSNISSKNVLKDYGNALYTWSLFIVGISFVLIALPFLQPHIPKMNLLYKSYGHNHIVNILFFVIPIALFKLKQKRSIWTASGVFILLCAFAVSFSRGGLVLLLMYCVYFIASHMSHKSTKIRLLLAGVCLCGAVGLILVFSNTALLKIPAFPYRSELSKSSIVDSRVQYWKQAAVAIKARPLFGWGPGSFSLVSKRFQEKPDSYSWYAHSTPLQILSESGIFVATAFLVLILLVIQGAAPPLSPRADNDHQHAAHFHGVILTILYSCVEMNLSFIVIWVLFWVVTGLLSRCRDRIQPGPLWVFNALVCSSLVLIGLYYTSNVLGSTATVFLKGTRAPFLAQPYDVKRTLAFIDTHTPEGTIHALDKHIIKLFHGGDPEVQFAISKYLYKEGQPDFFIAALFADPQNRSNFEEYITLILNKQQYVDLEKIIAVMISSISKQKGKDLLFLHNHWGDIYSCFNKDTLLWRDDHYTDTYQAKSLYFTSLCLIQNQQPESAREFLRIAVQSRPAWSNIYIDYASVLQWIYQDDVGADLALSLCKENIYARKHCSDFDTYPLPDVSISNSAIHIER